MKDALQIKFPRKFCPKNPQRRQVGMRSSNNDKFLLQLFIITINITIIIIIIIIRTF